MSLHLATGPSIDSGNWIIYNTTQTIKTSGSGFNVGWGATSGDAISLNYAANSSNNRLLIMVHLTVGLDFSGRIGAGLYIGGSRENAIAADTQGNIQRRTSGEHAGNDADISSIQFNYLKTSPSTSSTTYSVRLGQGDNGTRNVYINRPHNEPDQSYIMRGTSSITIMEFQHA